MVDELIVFSEIVNWSIILFILTRAISTACFSGLDWMLTLIGVLFAYFVRYISWRTRQKS